ncbi:MAG: MarR family transcriptional regulator [Deltaproteobacteria bacterium]|nr:MAG: MarR family transcriptional regulator [Deltaproteobacteria bacterium]
MKQNLNIEDTFIPAYQLAQFRELVSDLFQCCQERTQYQSEKFELPDAEIRCLLLFGGERYLTAKGIAYRLNVVKSRVTKIVDGLVHKDLVQRVRDPEDSRITLISLTHDGQEKMKSIRKFIDSVHVETLRQMTTDQRKTVLPSLDLLRSSMKAVKEMMV